MINAFKNIMNKKPEEVSNQKLYPLMLWFSNFYRNTKLCNYINKHFFFVKPEILKGLLSLAISRQARFIKYPKADKKDADDKMKIIEPYLKKLYGWSNRVLREQIKIIDLDMAFLENLNQKVGFGKKECKILGLEFKSFDVVKPKSIRQKSLF